MQESSKSFLIKDLLRDLVHSTDSSTAGSETFIDDLFIFFVSNPVKKPPSLVLFVCIVFEKQ